MSDRTDLLISILIVVQVIGILDRENWRSVLRQIRIATKRKVKSVINVIFKR